MFIYINGKKYPADPGESVLQIAIRNRVDIPHFCYHEDLPIEAGCRTCLVEIGETGKIATACTLKASDKLKVYTDTPKVKRLRLNNLELLLSGHKKNCPQCLKNSYCKTALEIKKHKVTTAKYPKQKIPAGIHKIAQAIEFDPQLCISCRKCAKICQKIGVGFLSVVGKGIRTHVARSEDPKIDCIYCGQCTVHCPVGSAREQSEIELVEKALQDKNKIVIAQMAPSVRVSLSEDFGLEPGTDLTGQIYTAFRKLGFDKIFDVNMGADITTIIEAEELIERINENQHLPMFTSCCPAWVKFIEFYHPELIGHLTTARSPQIHAGSAYKSWWAEKNKVDPKNIVVVSFMPCTSKKYEAKQEKLRVNGLMPVDHVLTSRELVSMLKDKKINLPKLRPSKVDLPGTYSGAGAIFGTSGGVMESALRTAYHQLTKKELPKISFKAVRGIAGIKKAQIKINGRLIKVAVVSTPANAEKIIQEIKKDKNAYDYIEAMACPGGCIAGGGQPIPTTAKIAQKRSQALYKIDSGMKLRQAHLNPVVKDFFEYADRLPLEERKAMLYTSYSPKNKSES